MTPVVSAKKLSRFDPKTFLSTLDGGRKIGTLQPGFSATQTVWRSVQSSANSSPSRNPFNREKYREFLHSPLQDRCTIALKVNIRQQLLAAVARCEQGFIRTVTGILMR
jgi:hypothetical protein